MLRACKNLFAKHTMQLSFNYQNLLQIQSTEKSSFVIKVAKAKLNIILSIVFKAIQYFLLWQRLVPQQFKNSTKF